MSRLLAEIMPALTLQARPKGLPIATTHSPIVELDPDGNGILDDVVVGEHQALRIDDETRAGALAQRLRSSRAVAAPAAAEEMIEEVVGIFAHRKSRAGDFGLNLDIDYRPFDRLDERRQRRKRRGTDLSGSPRLRCQQESDNRDCE